MQDQSIILLIEFIQSNAGALTLVSVLIAGLWTVYKFRDYSKDKRFEIYHRLIKELVDEQSNTDKLIKLDRQIAIVYELRSFPKYFEVTKRILNGLKNDWGGRPEIKRIVEEIDVSLSYINKGLIRRFWSRKNFRLW